MFKRLNAQEWVSQKLRLKLKCGEQDASTSYLYPLEVCSSSALYHTLLVAQGWQQHLLSHSTYLCMCTTAGFHGMHPAVKDSVKLTCRQKPSLHGTALPPTAGTVIQFPSQDHCRKIAVLSNNRIMGNAESFPSLLTAYTLCLPMLPLCHPSELYPLHTHRQAGSGVGYLHWKNVPLVTEGSLSNACHPFPRFPLPPLCRNKAFFFFLLNFTNTFLVQPLHIRFCSQI